ncbi:competence type IV pilus assembly protein ComGB [Bacillus sp. V2I10]|uniref:competence type IV pilus assembly protein ComGB n=1 Tax=Bacillus sp. V2I10 TaxID=3042276 RepID=UPI00278A191F|nr:competence type IV pilus assembly protein ComGB [Bacillus sp. V2I10]MDQ0858403.1 competence protein ComGB [Bacillus sp. V2I10]
MKIKKKWLIKDQAMFLKRLSDLLEKGYTLNEAMKFTSIDLNEEKKQAVFFCLRELSKGVPVRTAFEKLRFHNEVLSYLYFAERHGDLETALREGGEMLNRKLVQHEKMKKVLQYPLFLFFTIGILLYISQSVIAPQFQQIYHSMNIKPSILTEILFMIFQGTKLFLIFILMLFVLGSIFYISYFKKLLPQEKMRIAIKIPLWKKFVILINSYYFSLQLSNLLKGGLSIYESLTVFENQNLLPFYRDEASWFIDHLKKGERFEGLVARNLFYEKELTQVIGHGQANGHLARELYTYSQFVLERLENKLMKWIMLIQPAAYFAVGMTVLMMYLSMILPMYHMMEAL